MVPPCLRTIPLDTQRPSPIPVASFVETKGSKMRSITAGEIPCPESATTIFTPSGRSFAQLLDLFTLTRRDPPCGIASIALLTVLAMTWRISSPRQFANRSPLALGVHADVLARQPLPEESKDRVHDVADVGRRGVSSTLFMEAEGLRGDVRDSPQLLFGGLEIALCIRLERAVPVARDKGSW